MAVFAGAAKMQVQIGASSKQLTVGNQILPSCQGF
jgi:hypothetical protein